MKKIIIPILFMLGLLWSHKANAQQKGEITLMEIRNINASPALSYIKFFNNNATIETIEFQDVDAKDLSDEINKHTVINLNKMNTKGFKIISSHSFNDGKGSVTTYIFQKQ